MVTVMVKMLATPDLIKVNLNQNLKIAGVLEWEVNTPDDSTVSKS
jgi:hypothetical protein